MHNKKEMYNNTFLTFQCIKSMELKQTVLKRQRAMESVMHVVSSSMIDSRLKKIIKVIEYLPYSPELCDLLAIFLIKRKIYVVVASFRRCD